MVRVIGSQASHPAMRNDKVGNTEATQRTEALMQDETRDADLERDLAGDEVVEEPVATAEAETTESPVATAVIEPFIGQWNQLVSHTNWEKGRIICDWREALEEAGASSTEYSDEAWSRVVGNVTPQHVGRLRRVYQRFHGTYEQFPSLHWSHFFAALDWVDAEMWLEGAAQNGWSVSETRRMRQETLGAVATDEDDAEAMAEEMDEDAPVSGSDAEASEESRAGISRGGASGEGGTAVAESDDLGDEEERDDDDDSGVGSERSESGDSDSMGSSGAVSGGRPFADLPDLPDDLADAFDAFKLAILAHKTTDWDDVRPEQVLASLDALKKLVTGG